MEGLLRSNHITRADIEAVYAGLFIDAFTEFEALIERLCLGLFEGSLKSSRQPATRLLRVSPPSFARDVLFEGDKYVDWLPLEDRAIPRAKRFLRDGIPFSSLDLASRQALKKAHLLRNALAHRSDAATTNFLLSIGQLTLLPHEKTPSGFLRSQPQGAGSSTQFSIALQTMQSAAMMLCA
jgi:hypothetical protein